MTELSLTTPFDISTPFTTYINHWIFLSYDNIALVWCFYYVISLVPLLCFQFGATILCFQFGAIIVFLVWCHYCVFSLVLLYCVFSLVLLQCFSFVVLYRVSVLCYYCISVLCYYCVFGFVLLWC